jgi:hypothetical protein
MYSMMIVSSGRSLEVNAPKPASIESVVRRELALKKVLGS